MKAVNVKTSTKVKSATIKKGQAPKLDVNEPSSKVSSINNKEKGAFWLWIKKHWIVLVASLIMLFAGGGVALFLLLGDAFKKPVTMELSVDEIGGFYGYEDGDVEGNVYVTLPGNYHGNVSFHVAKGKNITFNEKNFVVVDEDTFMIRKGLEVGSYPFTIVANAPANGKYKATSKKIDASVEIFPAIPTGQVVKFGEWSFIPEVDYEGEPVVKLAIDHNGRYVGGQIEYSVTDEEHFYIENNILHLKPNLPQGNYITTICARLKNPAGGFVEGWFTESDPITISVGVKEYDLGKIIVRNMEGDSVGDYVTYPTKTYVIEKYNTSQYLNNDYNKLTGVAKSTESINVTTTIPTFILDTTNNLLPPEVPLNVTYSISNVTCQYLNNPSNGTIRPGPTDPISFFDIYSVVDIANNTRQWILESNDDEVRRWTNFKFDIKINAVADEGDYYSNITNTFSIVIADSSAMPGFYTEMFYYGGRTGRDITFEIDDPGYGNWYGISWDNQPIAKNTPPASSSSTFYGKSGNNSAYYKLFDGKEHSITDFAIPSPVSNPPNWDSLAPEIKITARPSSPVPFALSNDSIFTNAYGDPLDWKNPGFLTPTVKRNLDIWTQNGRSENFDGISSTTNPFNKPENIANKDPSFVSPLDSLKIATPYFLTNYRFYIDNNIYRNSTYVFNSSVSPFVYVPYEWEILGANDVDGNGIIESNDYELLLTERRDMPVKDWYDFTFNWNNVPANKHKPYTRYIFRIRKAQLRAVCTANTDTANQPLANGMVKYPAGYPTASDNDALNYGYGADQPDSPYDFNNIPKQSPNYLNGFEPITQQQYRDINISSIQVFGVDNRFFN